MKILNSLAAAVLLWTGTTLANDDVVSERSWSETFAVNTAQPVLELNNIWGDVRVKPGPAGEITLQVSERRSAPDQTRFDRSLESLKLHTRADADGVYMYVGGPDPDNWHDSNRCRRCRVDYQFELRVPVDTRLDVSTVNDGRVDIRGVSGTIIAGNVNGEIEVEFAGTPRQNCEIQTVNGDVTLGLPPGCGLDLAADLYNGVMRTELPVAAVAIPAKVEHIETAGRHQYRIEQPAGIRIAGGGPKFTISSINGDIQIQKIK